MADRLPVGAVVLGYLLQGPAHGYELLSRLHEDFGRVWRVAPSLLYFALNTLEREGLIRGERELQETRPPRVRYALTPKGEEAFWRWALSPVPRVRLLRYEFLPKLFFLLKLSPERVPELLSAQREVLLALRDKVAAEAPTDPFQRVLKSFRLHQLSAGLQWLEELLAQKEGSLCAKP